jgi:hypothetical protein
VGGERAATSTWYVQIVCTDTTTPKGIYSIMKDQS